MKLAILLATYNSSRYLAEQLDSLENQIYRDFTLYIRDDGSTDSTLQILRDYQARYGNIVVLHDPKRARRAMGSFIWLLDKVDADYYMFCDHDDVWLPQKVERSLAKIREIEEADRPALVCTDLIVTDSDLKTISPSLWSYMKLRPELLTKPRYAISCNLFTGCTMIINRAARDISLPVSPRAVMHDSWIGLRVIAAGGAVGWISEPQILYRQHGANVFGAQQAGGTLKYYLHKAKSIGSVADSYSRNFLMAKDALNGKLSIVKFLFFRILYLLKR